jgi:hypothetical protein
MAPRSAPLWLPKNNEFFLDKDEGLYGLGQLQNGQMMQRGIEKYLVQGNTEDVTPVFQSTKGYGVFWEKDRCGSAMV